MPLVSAASQHATDSTECSFPIAAGVAAGNAAEDIAGKEVSRKCINAAAFLGSSVEQQERPGPQQQQHQQTRHEQLKQQHNLEHPEHGPTGQGQEEEQRQQQQERAKHRRVCSGCNRPCSVCYCSIIRGRELSLSEQDVCSIVNRVLIFMHPLEKKRKNGSVSVLQKLVKGIEIWPHRRPGCCPFATEQQQQQQQREEENQHKMQEKAALQRAEGIPRVSAEAACSEGLERPEVADCALAGAAEGSGQQQQQQAQQQRQPEQQQEQHLCTREGVAVCDTSRMLLLFPTESSVTLGVGSLPVRLPVTLLAIDGTWKEAKEMFSASPWLQKLPAVHLPIRQEVVALNDNIAGSAAAAAGTDPAAAGANAAASCCRNSSTDNTKALRVSGAYGMIRTPPARVAASGGVCTAEAIAEALSVLGSWARSGSSPLLNIGETTRETLQCIVSLQQRMRGEGRDRELTA
ncbi:hypothetical protein, conserved [Eimeria acervulina]|uniref:tRNA-uridine aminocarboxypropyltransferase n=1 Tax=Eimeria acervulina TaxID=5801 RepID=U6GHH7_EIMAC|nr:hypothetical protein, conserved [Eimeria acervulina]CDI78748.1 hypothetical protein, conserved [Eimeria acervulina]